MKQVGVFVATRWEFNAIREAIAVDKPERMGAFHGVVGRRGGVQVRLIQTGVGIDRAGAASRKALTTYPFELVISAGFACALSSARIGDLLIGTDVIQHGGGWSTLLSSSSFVCSSDYRDIALQTAREVTPTSRSGRFVTVSHVLWRAEHKREVAAANGGVASDMESAAIAESAHMSRVPFMIARAVSDLVDEDLPLDFNLFLRPTGWFRGLAMVMAHPSSLVGLHRLWTQSAEAAARLTVFYGKFFDALRE